MSAPIISVYLGPLRAKWEQYCLLKGVKSSAALRQIVHHLISKESLTQTVIHEAANGGKAKRIEIRLKPTLYAELQRRSQVEGFSPNRLISGLLDAQLIGNQVPLLSQYELDGLTASTSQLLRLGTNLNQIARAINRNPLETDLARLELLLELRQHITSHTEHVAGLIEGNLKRWSIK
jgi:hypothetical protein